MGNEDEKTPEAAEPTPKAKAKKKRSPLQIAGKIQITIDYKDLDFAVLLEVQGKLNEIEALVG